jgi:hypothetical protein
VVSFTPRLLYLWGKSPRTHWLEGSEEWHHIITLKKMFLPKQEGMVEKWRK